MISDVLDDGTAFYGRQYWFSHQEVDLCLPNLTTRARRDLPERCLYWLQHVLEHKLPPGRALEIGCGHGGFVRLLRLSGFDAMGLELSPWVVRYAQASFDIPVFLGRLENQVPQPSSFDLIILMDVLEHLPEPAVTLGHCLEHLKPEGLLIIQTPAYPEGATIEQLQQNNEPFLKMLLPREHLHLFSQQSLLALLNRLGASKTYFCRPMFPEHDMFVFAGRLPLTNNSLSDIEDTLAATPSGRIIQALFDQNEGFRQLQRTSIELQQALRQQYEAMRRTNLALEEHSVAAQQRLVAVHELTNILQTKQHFINDLQRAADDRLSALQELTEVVEARDARVFELEKAAHERLLAINELTAGLEARDALIAQLERATQGRLHDLNRLTAPLPNPARDKSSSDVEPQDSAASKVAVIPSEKHHSPSRAVKTI
jgi:SAM-dependent methyltransferase